MDKSRADQIAKGMLETVETMFDTHPMFEDADEDQTWHFGEVRARGEGNGFYMPVTIEGQAFVLTACPVA